MGPGNGKSRVFVLAVTPMDLLRAKPLNLANIRYALIRQEETIIFKLIERAQFPRNASIYRRGAVPIPDFTGSFLDFVLKKSEESHALVRRYQSPDEYPFSDGLPDPILPPLEYPPLIHADGLNVNDRIKEFYELHIVPTICPDTEDRGERQENYGSAAVCDVDCLQALSRRIHFGKFVAEVKFLAEKEKYTEMIKNRDIEGLATEITNPDVEMQVLARLEKKALNYGRDPADPDKSQVGTVDVNAVVNIYEHFVIPLTKAVEIEYLLRRLDG